MELDPSNKIRIPFSPKEVEPEIKVDWHIKYYYGPQFHVVRKAPIHEEDKIRFSVSGDLIYPVRQPSFEAPILYKYDLQDIEIASITYSINEDKIIKSTKLSKLKQNIEDLRQDSIRTLSKFLLQLIHPKLHDFFLIKLGTSPLRRMLQSLIYHKSIGIPDLEKFTKYLEPMEHLELIQIEKTQLSERINIGPRLIEIIASTEKEKINSEDFFVEIVNNALYLVINHLLEESNELIFRTFGTHFDILSMYYEYCILDEKIQKMPIDLLYSNFVSIRSGGYSQEQRMAFEDYLFELHHATLLKINIEEEYIHGNTATFRDFYKILKSKFRDLPRYTAEHKIPMWSEVI